MSVKKNILTISWISLLLSGSVKAMDPEQEPRFIKHKPRAERTSDLRLSVIREEKQLPKEDWELLRLQKNLAEAQRQVDSAKEDLRLKREARNMLHKRVKALEKEKTEASQTIETKNSKKKKKKATAHHTIDRSQK